MASALAKFQKLYLKENPYNSRENEPIWFNPRLKLPYIKIWDQKGLRNVGDLVNKEGVLKTRLEFEEDFGITINFIDLIRISKAVPQEFLGKTDRTQEAAPWCQPFILNILNDNKTNQNIKKNF